MQRPKIASARSFFVDWFHLCYGKGSEHARWLDVVELPLSCFPWLGLQCHPIVTCIRRPKSPPVAYSITMYSTSISSSGSRMRTMMQNDANDSESQCFYFWSQDAKYTEKQISSCIDFEHCSLMSNATDRQSCKLWWSVIGSAFHNKNCKNKLTILASNTSRQVTMWSCRSSLNSRPQLWSQIETLKPGAFEKTWFP